MKKYEKTDAKEQPGVHQNFLHEPDAFYEKAEMDQLKEALKKNDKEKFLTMTRLMKLNIMLSKAKITYPEPPSK